MEGVQAYAAASRGTSKRNKYFFLTISQRKTWSTKIHVLHSKKASSFFDSEINDNDKYLWKMSYVIDVDLL